MVDAVASVVTLAVADRSATNAARLVISLEAARRVDPMAAARAGMVEVDAVASAARAVLLATPAEGSVT